mmetsp:Transcript_50570/g.75568  ORF Transcript_50570/g.75568 Transcript_50570/m.75568 type:complete len:84 (-) Transcript_50570:211-462(-)
MTLLKFKQSKEQKRSGLRRKELQGNLELSCCSFWDLVRSLKRSSLVLVEILLQLLASLGGNENGWRGSFDGLWLGPASCRTRR